MIPNHLVAVAVDVALIVIAIVLSKTTQIIRDVSCMPEGQKPYSFARTQLMWWTVIVMGCFMYAAIVSNQVPELNATALMLLGISTATTASGAIIDNTDMRNLPPKLPADNLPDGQEADKLERHQDTITTGFISDLLNDAQGTSIHRFQCLLVNVVVGIIYISRFVDGVNELPIQLPDFGSESIAALLGISSAGYITLKASENKPEVLKTVNEEKTAPLTTP